MSHAGGSRNQPMRECFSIDRGLQIPTSKVKETPLKSTSHLKTLMVNVQQMASCGWYPLCDRRYATRAINVWRQEDPTTNNRRVLQQTVYLQASLFKLPFLSYAHCPPLSHADHHCSAQYSPCQFLVSEPEACNPHLLVPNNTPNRIQAPKEI